MPAIAEEYRFFSLWIRLFLYDTYTYTHSLANTDVYMHSLHVCEHTAAVHSRQRGQDYVMFKWGVFKHARVHVQLFKRPMETYTQHSSASVTLICHRVWLWRSHEVWLKPNYKF